MKRTRIIGLALMMAMFAVSAVGTSAASAHSHWVAASFPVNFTGKGDGSSKFETPKGNIVVCEKSSSVGKVIGELAAEATVTYSECKLTGEVSKACPNIVTLTLSLAPVDRLNLKVDTIGVLISPKAGSSLAHFTCGGFPEVSVTVKGSLICETQPSFGVATTKGLIGCRQGANLGEQQFKTALNSSLVDTEDFLTAESGSILGTNTEKDAQITHELVTYAAAIQQTL